MPIIAAWTFAAALQAAPACPATPAPLPAELSGWSAMTAVDAGADATAAAPIPIGRGARATLVPSATLRFARAPEKAAAPGSFGGLFAVTVARAGRYRIALGEGAWVDVIGGDRTLVSVAHGHGPACSPVRKMVDFDLAPGRYIVQVASARTATLSLLVAAVAR